MSKPTIITFSDNSATHRILSTHIVAMSRLPATETHPERTRVDYEMGQGASMTVVVNDSREDHERNVALWRAML